MSYTGEKKKASKGKYLERDTSIITSDDDDDGSSVTFLFVLIADALRATALTWDVSVGIARRYEEVVADLMRRMA